MGDKIVVQFAQLREARHQMDAAINVYNDSISQLRQAAEKLASGWEGDGQVAFVNSQNEAFNWYLEMSGIVGQIIQTLTTIAELLESAEQTIASGIRA